MSAHTFHAPFNSRDLISERAARRAAAHPRTVVAKDAAAPPADPVVNTVGTVREVGSSSAGSPQILRRWSVAKLVAAATWPRVIASAMIPPPGARG
jgi:hypothetical protein